MLLDNSIINQDFASTATPVKGLKANRFDNYLENELVGLLEFTSGKELKGDWGAAIKAVENAVKVSGKTFRGVSRAQPLFNLIKNESGRIGKQDGSRGFWFVHIQATVPFPD